jgi:uncharacterized glyoxalase superfamily protein PhnB
VANSYKEIIMKKTDSYCFNTVILVVADIEKAERFYQQSLGLRIHSRIRDEAQTVINSTLEGHDICLLLSCADPEHGTLSPASAGVNSLTVVLTVPDVDRLTQQFVKAGGSLRSGPKDRYWGVRAALVEDHDGHRWMLQTPIKPLTDKQIQQALKPWIHETLES